MATDFTQWVASSAIPLDMSDETVPATDLGFTVSLQQPFKNLCWAYLSSAISQFYPNGANFSPCQVAEAVKGPGCCDDLSNCDSASPLQPALHAVAQDGNAWGAQASFAQIQQEVGGNRHVVCVGYQWAGDSDASHFFAIEGFTDDAVLLVQDSYYGPSTQTYDDLSTSGLYQGSPGAWIETHYTLG